MYLRIMGTLHEKFIAFILQRMKMWFRANVNYDKMKAFELYYNALHPEKEAITSKQICELGLNSLEAVVSSEDTTFQFNQNVFLVGHDEKLIDVLQTINYGNILIEPYPIFSEMFDYFTNEFETLYRYYYGR